jgi:serine O-acetyltransferase
MLSELIETILVKDPAARSGWEIVLCYPGLHAVVLHSLAHQLYLAHHFLSARLISHISRSLTGIEIHPGATIGRRLFIDHGMGVVIGETAVIGDDVVIYQGASLGAGAEARMGKTTQGRKRHPTIGNGVVIGSGAEIQGDISVGDGSRIASGAVVLKNVPANAVVVGVPGRIIRQDGRPINLESADPEAAAIKALRDRIERLEQQIKVFQDIKAVTADMQPVDDPVELFLHGAGI